MGFALLACVGGFAAWWWTADELTHPSEPDEGAQAGALEADPSRDESRGESGQDEAPGPPTRPPPPPVSASAPPGCPEDEGDPGDFVRPSVWDLLRIRTQELRDRLPQLSRDASPALREGLNEMGGDDPHGAVERIRGAEDRDRDGFDIALSAMLHLGMRALAQDDEADARAWATAAAREAPEDPMAHTLAAMAASRGRDPVEAAEAMQRAFDLAGDEPAIALSLARLEAENGRFGEAAAAADAYLREVPEDHRLSSWRRRMADRAELTRAHGRRSWSGIDVISPDAVSPARVDELMEATRDALDEVADTLGREPRSHLVVVIYRSLEEMRRATCAPSWSGGIFDGVLHLDAATVNGPRWTRVVRHEATHAQLGLIRGRIPTWLNEGLAQHMEGPLSSSARASFSRMSERGYWIPLASLEGELLLIDDPADARLAYHQSLAMVLYLLEHGADLGAAVHHIEEGEPEDLLPRLLPGTDGPTLLAFMRTR